MSAENVEFVKSLYEAFGRGDIAYLLERMSPAFRWLPAENSPMDRGRPFIGSQDVLDNVFTRIGGEWENFKVKPERFLDAGDTVVVEGRYAGASRATGKNFDAQMLHIWVVRDGQLHEFRQYTDTAQARDVMSA